MHNNTSFYNALKPLKNNIYTNGQDIFYYFDAQYAECYDVPSYSRDMSDRENNQQSAFLALRNTEASTFISLNCFYSKDAQRVYFCSKVIPADADTFEVLDGLFAKDKNGIWYNGRHCPKIVDGASFEVISKGINYKYHFAKDKHHVYSSPHPPARIEYQGYAMILQTLRNSDPNTFQEINDVWAKDKNNVYWYGKIYKKADAATFEQISEQLLTRYDYAKDKNHVYIDRGQTLKKGLDGKSFIILNSYWAKDDFVVYCMYSERILKSIDYETFTVIDENGKAEDKNYTYEFDYNGLKKKAQ